MVAAVAYLAACAACGAHPAASFWATAVPIPQPFHCPACRPGLLTAEEQLALPDPVVGLIGYAPEARWCVLEVREHGLFLARPLGLHGAHFERVFSVADVRPRFSYEKLAASRTAR